VSLILGHGVQLSPVCNYFVICFAMQSLGKLLIGFNCTCFGDDVLYKFMFTYLLTYLLTYCSKHGETGKEQEETIQ